MSDDRMSFDSYFLALAELASKRSTCIRRKVGAVAVLHSRIIATGYNGAPADMKHCTKDTCIRHTQNIPSGTNLELCKAVHAEQNLIIQCAKYGVSMKGAHVYCTTFPCTTCMKMLINVGAKALIWKTPYNNEYSKALMVEKGFFSLNPKPFLTDEGEEYYKYILE